MNEKQLEQHVPILGVLHLIGGAIFVVVGAFIFIFLSGIGAVIDDPIGFRILTITGLSVGTLLVVLGVPGMAAGYGLLKWRSWARALAIAVGVLNLINVPIGTIIGVYTLVVLMQTDAATYFVSLKQA